jgi:hypothetical protein
MTTQPERGKRDDHFATERDLMGRAAPELFAAATQSHPLIEAARTAVPALATL